MMSAMTHLYSLPVQVRRRYDDVGDGERDDEEVGGGVKSSFSEDGQTDESVAEQRDDRQQQQAQRPVPRTRPTTPPHTHTHTHTRARALHYEIYQLASPVCSPRRSANDHCIAYLVNKGTAKIKKLKK